MPQKGSKSGSTDWELIHRRLESLSRPAVQSEPAAVKKSLAARAAALARAPLSTAAEEGTLEVLQFSLAGERYAFETAHVKEVTPLTDLTVVPCTPPFVAGIINLRGNILSIIDIKRFFGLPEKGITDLNKVIVLGSPAMDFGVLADMIEGVNRITPESLADDFPTFTDIRRDFLKGVTPERVAVLDALKLLEDKRLIVHEEV